MKSLKKIKITKEISIKKALKVISDGAIKIAFVVDKMGKLIGTLTDGDIRRGFLNGLDLNSPIKSIINYHPLTADKNDINDKLLQIALSKKIYQIPIIDKNKKVVGAHIVDEFIKPYDKSNKVVIMAGGMGVRLRPLTKNLPKPMLKVGNKPILEIIINKIKKSGYKNIIISVKYKSKIIKNYFGNGKKFGVKIDYIHEKKKMGTAGALSLIKAKFNEPFFVINGDIITNLDFEKMIDFHKKHKSQATMCIREYTIQSPYGEIKTDNENIVSIEEKPTHKAFVNAGIYILNPECINFIPKKFYDMPTLFKKMIAEKKKTVSFPLGEYWMDIGGFNEYKKANIDYDSNYIN